MKALYLLSFLLSSCSAMPQISEDIKEIANNDAITIKVDRDAFGIETDIMIDVRVINKDPIPAASPQPAVK